MKRRGREKREKGRYREGKSERDQLDEERDKDNKLESLLERTLMH